MKKIVQFILLAVSCFIFKPISAQIADPVHWSFQTTKINDCEFELIIKANLDEQWHLYGQKSYGDDGPYPTVFHFAPNSNYELIGKTSEETLIKKYEPVFGVELNYFEHEAFFKQRVKIKSDSLVVIKGDFEFMVCNEVTCMPPSTVPFSFTIQGSKRGKGYIIFNLAFCILFIFFSISFLGGFEISMLSSFVNKYSSVAIVTGFLLVAIALKFASNVDVGMQTDVITRDGFIACWVVIGALIGIYLLGGIKFSKDTAVGYVSVSRLFFAILVLAFTFYLIPGLWGAPLKLVNAIIPH